MRPCIEQVREELYLPVPLETMQRVEAEWIKALQPQFNKERSTLMDEAKEN